MAATKMEKPGKGATKWSAAQKSDFDKIIGRAKELGKKLKPENFDKDGNPVDGPWAKVLGELDAWAKKYKVDFVTTQRKRSGGTTKAGATPRSHTVCPGTTHSTERVDFTGGGSMTIEHTCTLRRQGLFGRCIYSCIGQIVS
jgi:hypothetical protein